MTEFETGMVKVTPEYVSDASRILQSSSPRNIQFNRGHFYTDDPNYRRSREFFSPSLDKLCALGHRISVGRSINETPEIQVRKYEGRDAKGTELLGDIVLVIDPSDLRLVKDTRITHVSSRYGGIALNPLGIPHIPELDPYRADLSLEIFYSTNRDRICPIMDPIIVVPDEYQGTEVSVSRLEMSVAGGLFVDATVHDVQTGKFIPRKLVNLQSLRVRLSQSYPGAPVTFLGDK